MRRPAARNAPTTSSNSAWRRTTTISTYNSFPSGSLWPCSTVDSGNGDLGACWGWGVGPLVQVFNYMEQTVLYNAYNASRGVWGSYPPSTSGPTLWWANTTVFNTTVSGFLCPSDPRQLPPSSQMTVINYGGNFGGPFAMGGYTGTIVPDANPGSWSTVDTDKLLPTAQHDRGRERPRRHEQHLDVERAIESARRQSCDRLGEERGEPCLLPCECTERDSDRSRRPVVPRGVQESPPRDPRQELEHGLPVVEYVPWLPEQQL